MVVHNSGANRTRHCTCSLAVALPAWLHAHAANQAPGGHRGPFGLGMGLVYMYISVCVCVYIRVSVCVCASLANVHIICPPSRHTLYTPIGRTEWSFHIRIVCNGVEHLWGWMKCTKQSERDTLIQSCSCLAHSRHHHPHPPTEQPQIHTYMHGELGCVRLSV